MGGGSVVIPDSSNGIDYDVFNSTGMSILHDHSTGPGGVDTINSLTTNGNFNLTGGTLSGDATTSAFTTTGTATLSLGGGTLRDFTVSGNAVNGTGSVTLDTDTFNSNLNLGGTTAFVLNSLTIGTGSAAVITGAGILEAANTSTLSGAVLFNDANGGNRLSVGNSATLTLASGSLVHGISGDIGQNSFTGGNGTLVNNGTISSDGGGTITLDGNLTGVQNNNGGVLQAKSSTPPVTTPPTAPVGSTLTLNTGVDNTAPTGGTAGTLNIADTASTIFDNGQTITGGTVTGAGSMTFSGSTANVLNGVTFNGAGLSLTNGGVAFFTNALTLTNGSVATIASAGILEAGDNGTTHADTLSGTVLFNDANGGNRLSVGNSATLTLASGSLVHGISGDIGQNSFTGGNGILVNNGTIASDGGGTISVDSNLSSFTSNGALVAKNGSTLTSNVNVTGTGTVSALDTSTVNLNAGSALNQTGGTSQVDGTANLNGTFTLTSGTLNGTGTLTNTNVVNNGGTVKPGDPPGTLTISGTYAQNNGTLNIEFNNATHSLLAVGGTATTGGTVNFSFLDKTVNPSVVGETFDFLTSAVSAPR